MSGLDAVAEAALGAPVSETPSAQERYRQDDRLSVCGSFRRTRHPINVAFLPLIWSAWRRGASAPPLSGRPV